MLSDIVTRGAGPFDSFELNTRLDAMGVHRSEMTGWNFISLSGALLPEHLPTVLDLYADILLRAHLPAGEVEPALDGVEQSLRAIEDEPHRKVFVEVRRSSYDDPWGRPTEGTLEELSNITHELLQQYYSRCFRPNGTILGIAGRVNPEEIRDRLETLLGNSGRPTKSSGGRDSRR